MNKIISLLILLISTNSFGQKAQAVSDSMPVSSNGLSYGYNITNEKSRNIKGEEYDRFEIELFVHNEGGCALAIPQKMNRSGEVDESVNISIANFSVQNANGRRLTAKGGDIDAKPWYLKVKIEASQALNGQTRINALIGNGIKSGETITKKITVLVPKGERPKIVVKQVQLTTLF